MVSLFLPALGGIIIGILVAAPIGPVNLICIRRTLAYGPLNGFFSVLGGVAGDGIFAAISAFGLTAMSRLIEGYATPLKLAGGIILIGYGIHNFRAEVTDPRNGCPVRTKELGEATLHAAIAGSFFLTLTNPATLIGFAALFAGLGTLVGDDASFPAAAALVGGVVLGSAFWWLTITTLTGAFHRHINARTMHRINHISGAVVTAFGLLVLADLLFVIV